MPASREVIANIRLRLEQLATELDRDPNVTGLSISVYFDRRSGRVTETKIDTHRTFEAAPPGAVVRAELDNG